MNANAVPRRIWEHVATPKAKTRETRPLAPFGVRLRKLIRQAGFSSKTEFVRAMGIGAMTLYRYEIGERVPTQTYLEQMSDLLGVSIDVLIGREQDGPPYDAWTGFLETAHGQGMSDVEQKTLASIRFPSELEPTIESYTLMLSGVRMALSV